MTVAGNVLLAVVGLVIVAKTLAYLVEMIWLIRGTTAQMYRELLAKDLPHAELRRLETEDLHRPRWVFSWADRRQTMTSRVLGVLFSTPPLVLIGSVVELFCAGPATRLAAGACGFALALLTLIALATASFNRLLLGSLDERNPDIRLPEPIAARLAPEIRRTPLTVYFLALSAILVVGFGGAYTGLMADPKDHAFHGGEAKGSGVYLSIVTAATVGYGDIYPESGLARAVTAMQITTGPLLLAWVLTVFTSRPLGERVEEGLPGEATPGAEGEPPSGVGE